MFSQAGLSFYIGNVLCLVLVFQLLLLVCWKRHIRPFPMAFLFSLLFFPSIFPSRMLFPTPPPLSNEQSTSLRAHFLVFQETGSKLLRRQIRCFVSSLKSENRWLSIFKGKLHVASFSFTGPAFRFLNHILQLKLTECVTGLNWIRQLYLSFSYFS